MTVMENLGIITFLMMRNPAFKELSLSQISGIVEPPLAKRLAVTATLPNKDGANTVPLAFALFAKVNDDWDAKLRDPGFPITNLPAEAWDSGGNKWMVAFLSTQKTSGAFVEKAARAIWPKGGTLHIRAAAADGSPEIGKRKF